MIKVGVVGATGYTGMELVRILTRHPGVKITYATSRTWAGRALSEALPGLSGWSDLVCEEFSAREAAVRADIIFLCLPHGGAMEAVSQLHDLKVRQIDLSADFRIADLKVYERWYGTHSCPHLLSEAVNGFPELFRENIAEASLVANPGCYPSTSVYGLLPLAEKCLIEPGSIIVDLAAERGGNCELTRPGQTVVEKGVRILGPPSVTATVNSKSEITSGSPTTSPKRSAND